MAVVLILIGTFLIIFSSYSLIKEKPVIKEQSFSTVLETRENSIDDKDLLIGEMRREFAETIMELQIDILNLKENMNQKNDIHEDLKEKVEVEETPEKIENSEIKTFNNTRINDLDKLLKEGFTLDEISEKLEISKGEILLIKDLYLK